MAFNLATAKLEDFSMKLRAQNFSSAKDESRKLELDNKKMEERLRELKLAMNRERTEREQMHGGTFWQSGQTGALSTYAKDVLKKPARQDQMKHSVSRVQSGQSRVKVLKDEPIVVQERPKGPGTTAYIAQKAMLTNEATTVKDNRHRCGQCEDKVALVSCVECGEDYCAACFAAFHLRGALKKHRSVPVGAARLRTPRGDAKRTPAADFGNVGKENVETVNGGRSKLSSATGLAAAQSSRLQNNSQSVPVANDRNTRSESSNGQSRLIDGNYDEEENAASFQEAVRAWRGEPHSQQKPAKQPKTTFAEHATSTTETSVQQQQQQPVQIKFTPSLTYAEKLMLKRHRRMELPSASNTARSCGSALDNIDDTTPRRFVETDEFDTRLRSLSARSAIAVGNSYDGFDSATDDDEFEERNESRISIIELTEMTPTDHKLDKSSKYSVTNCGDDPPISDSRNPSGKPKLRRSAFTKSSKMPEASDFIPRPPASTRRSSEIHVSSTAVENATSSRKSIEGARNKVHANGQSVDMNPKQSARQLPTNQTSARKSGSYPSTGASRSGSQTDLDIKADDMSRQIKPDDATANKQKKKNPLPTSARSEAAASSRKEPHSTAPVSEVQQPGDGSLTAQGNSTARQRGQGLSSRSARSTPRHQSDSKKSATATDGRKSAADGRITSRPSSRQSVFGDGLLTKTPSEALHQLATLDSGGDLTNSNIQASDLGKYFTLGMKQSDSDPMQSARSDRTFNSSTTTTTPRPNSSRLRVSNQLYQLGPRSWKPEASLATSVPDDQAEPVVREMCNISDRLWMESEDRTVDGNADDKTELRAGDVTVQSSVAQPAKRKHASAKGPGPNGNLKQIAESSDGRGTTPASTDRNRKQQKLPDNHHNSSSSTNNNNNNFGHIGPWAVDSSVGMSTDELLDGGYGVMSFSVSTGVELKQGTGVASRSANVADDDDDLTPRCFTPNLMVPKRSVVVPNSARSSIRPATARSVTPSTGRESRMIVVDGEDLSQYDDADRTLEQSRDDTDTLTSLYRELSEQTINTHSSENKTDGTALNKRNATNKTVNKISDDDDVKQRDTVLQSSEDFDLQTKLRESALMYDFEEMEAEIMGQMEVKALP